MTSFRLSNDAHSDVLRMVQSVEDGVLDAFVKSRALCDRIAGSIRYIWPKLETYPIFPIGWLNSDLSSGCYCRTNPRLG